MKSSKNIEDKFSELHRRTSAIVVGKIVPGNSQLKPNNDPNPIITPLTHTLHFAALSAAQPTTRAAFLRSSLVLPLLTTLPSPAFAKFGASIYPSPSEAVVDKEVLGSDSVQKSLTNIKGYLATARSLKQEVASNSQADLIPGIRKGFDFAALRSDLNTVTTIFDEETQRATDRVNRVILQDITELEASAKFKGEVRARRCREWVRE